jgi:hypothetical protein
VRKRPVLHIQQYSLVAQELTQLKIMRSQLPALFLSLLLKASFNGI